MGPGQNAARLIPRVRPVLEARNFKIGLGPVKISYALNYRSALKKRRPAETGPRDGGKGRLSKRDPARSPACLEES